MDELHYVIECEKFESSTPCPFEGEPCYVIVAEATADVRDDEGNVSHPAGSVLWASHSPIDIDPATRISADYPIIEDRRDTPTDTVEFRDE